MFYNSVTGRVEHTDRQITVKWENNFHGQRIIDRDNTHISISSVCTLPTIMDKIYPSFIVVKIKSNKTGFTCYYLCVKHTDYCTEVE